MIELVTKTKKPWARYEYITSNEGILKAGFQWIKIPHPEITFVQEPEIQNLLKIIESKSSTVVGDNRYYCQSDIVVNSMTYLDGTPKDAQSVAACIIYGKLMNGNISFVLKNKTSVSLRQQLEETLPVEQKVLQESEESQKQMVNIVHNQFQDLDMLKRFIGYAYYYQDKLGSDNQYRFEVPHHVDFGMESFGFSCVEKPDFDLFLLDKYPKAIKISDKMGKELIQCASGKFKKARGSKIYSTSTIIMSNFQGSSETSIRRKPEFDVLIVFQHTPFLACGIVPHYVLKFKPKKTTYNSDRIPLSEFKWVIDPAEKIVAAPLSPAEEKMIDDYVEERHHPTLFKKLLALPKA